MTAADLARALVTSIQQRRHYGADHQAANASLEDLFIAMRRQLTPAGAVRIELAALHPESQHAAALAAHLSARSVQSLTLRSETSLSDLGALVRLLSLEPEELIAEGGLATALRQLGVGAIEVGEIGPAPGAERGGSDPVRAAAVMLDHLVTEAARTQAVNVTPARRVSEDLVHGFAKNPIAIWQAIADRGHDELDAMHGVATAVLAIATAEALEMPEGARIDLGLAALVHDIGLAALPHSMRVRERTTEGAQDSWRHPSEGGHLLRDAEDGGWLAMIVAMEHHLPALRDGDALPHSCLVAMADYVDAMTAARAPGLRRQTMDAIMAHLLAGEGPRFDPVHVRLLAGVLHDAATAGVDFWR